VFYNVAAGSFLSKRLCSRLHSIEVDFYSKKEKISSIFGPSFGRLIGNVRTSSIARWKARVQLPIRFLRAGALRSPIKGGRGRRPPTTVG